jgi:alginate O-acetyltransferase complex protein AlgI
LTPHVDSFFQNTANLTGAEGWIAAYLFAFQIFFDFSAYSEMALGIAYFFGLELAVNFRTPYLSKNPTEFWRRWHITLSNWIKDYIYIPLGGSRNGEVRQFTNLFIAMTISGIWHGASWTFVAWGMFYGALATVHKLYMMLKEKLGLSFLDKSRIYQFIAIIVFFHITGTRDPVHRRGGVPHPVPEGRAEHVYLLPILKTWERPNVKKNRQGESTLTVL